MELQRQGFHGTAAHVGQGHCLGWGAVRHGPRLADPRGVEFADTKIHRLPADYPIFGTIAVRTSRLASKKSRKLIPFPSNREPVSYTHLRAHETRHDLVCRL